LFLDEDPVGHKDKDFREFINPESLKVLESCQLEPSLATAKPGDSFQFQRLGYFNVDKDSTADKLVINRTVPLRDSWAKKNK
jgi:glutaminyl-tRNA synthetase